MRKINQNDVNITYKYELEEQHDGSIAIQTPIDSDEIYFSPENGEIIFSNIETDEIIKSIIDR